MLSFHCVNIRDESKIMYFLFWSHFYLFSFSSSVSFYFFLLLSFSLIFFLLSSSFSTFFFHHLIFLLLSSSSFFFFHLLFSFFFFLSYHSFPTSSTLPLDLISSKKCRVRLLPYTHSQEGSRLLWKWGNEKTFWKSFCSNCPWWVLI